MTNSLYRYCGTMAVVLLLTACATIDTARTSDSEVQTSVINTPTPRASLNVKNQSLGEIFRALTKQTKAGLVLMNGLENIRIDGLAISDEPLPDILKTITRAKGLSIHVTPHYTFIYDPDYEALVTMDISASLPAGYAEERVFAAFGSDMPVFSVLTLLSHATGKTLVADNAVADSLCGELNLQDVPLPQAIESVLQSARIPQSSIQIRATEDYIFIHSAGHPLRREVASKDIPASSRNRLEEKCSVSLLVYTEADGKVRSQLGASKLYKVLPELALQLGMPVRVDPKLEHFPVNPVVMSNVTREVALKLLIHQWMVPEFEFTMLGDSILIRQATSN